MSELFSSLTQAIDGTPAVAMGAALIWGILSVVLSPCHLASIPLIVGFMGQQGPMNTRRAFIISLVFSVGILITIAAIGGVTALAGRMMGDVGRWGNYCVSLLLLVIGLYLVDAIRLPLPEAVQPKVTHKGVLAAYLLGLIYGLALGPCTFAYMAPVLGIAFRVASTRPFYALALLSLYGVGHCAVIVFAGTCAGTVQRYLAWTEASGGAARAKKICGVLVIIAGLWLLSAC